MIYQFKYDEIHHCHECPLFYDYIHCELDCNKEYTAHTDSDDNKRPDWCPLKELMSKEEYIEYINILNTILNTEVIYND